MDKQEISQLDLSRWVIVHETPFLAWIGEVPEAEWRHAEETARNLENGTVLDGLMASEPLGLCGALILQTTQVPQPGPRPGIVQMGIITTVTSPHSFTTESLLVCVQPRAITLFTSLSQHDQHQLRTKIEMAKHQLVVMRLGEAGIVTPGAP